MLTQSQIKRRQRAAATAEQLLTAARQVFTERGYQATTVGAITEAANTAHGTFYLYFRNKEDAFTKVMTDVIGDMMEEAEAPWNGDLRSAVARAIRRVLEVFRAHRGLWRCLFEGMHQSPAIERMWLDLRRPFFERIEQTLDRMVGAGLVRPMNTRLAAHALGAMVEWFAFTNVELGEPPLDEVPIDDAVEALTDLWLHAVYAGALPRLPAAH